MRFDREEIASALHLEDPQGFWVSYEELERNRTVRPLIVQDSGHVRRKTLLTLASLEHGWPILTKMSEERTDGQQLLEEMYGYTCAYICLGMNDSAQEETPIKNVLLDGDAFSEGFSEQQKRWLKMSEVGGYVRHKHVDAFME